MCGPCGFVDRVDRVDGVDHTAGEESPRGLHSPHCVVDKNCLDCVALFFQVVSLCRISKL